MDERYPAYAEVKKCLPSKKHKQMNNKKQEPIYSEVGEYPSNFNQIKKKTESSEENRFSVPFAWRLTVVILAGSCFFLFLATGILGFLVFQGRLTAQVPNSPLENVTREEEFHDRSLVFTSSPVNTGGKKSEYEVHWSCCGESCYYFSREKKNFEDSMKLCKKMNSTLVKIEDAQELNFIQSQISYFCWIGLSREGTSRPWTWEDKSQPSLESDWKESETGNCGSITPTRMNALECSRLITYICEKKNVCLATVQ
ncbi:killer cell lectin-like receptor 7 isoform X2 [Fukomys damarensis]|nr:killer cell lectin-like receptor 7 isoform X2 [Fukomys damarensis]